MTRTRRWRTRRPLSLLILTALVWSAALPAVGFTHPDYPGMNLIGRPSVVMFHAGDEIYVNTLLANLFHTREDLLIGSPGIPLDFTTSYNSMHNLDRGEFGYGWQGGYSQRVERFGSELLLHWGDGRRDRFVLDSGLFRPLNEALQVTLVESAPDRFEACTLQQICYRFDEPSHGGVTEVAEPNGRMVRLHYGADGLARQVVDDNGLSVLIKRDADGRVVELIDSSTTPSRRVRYRYDGAGDLVEVVDARGLSTRYEYDCPHLLSRIVDPRGVATRISYDGAAQVRAIDNGIRRAEFAYNLFDRSTTVIERIDPTTSRTTRYDYDADHRLVRAVDGLGGATLYGYDAAGHLTSIESPEGRTTSLLHDARGNLLSSTNAFAETTSYSYDATFNKIDSITNPEGETLSYSYDARGNLTSVTDDDGATESFSMDGDGNIIGYTDARGHLTGFDYDSFGNFVGLTHPAPLDDETTRFDYDPIYRLSRATDAAGAATAWSYDEADHLTTMTNPLGNGATFRYDGVGNAVEIVDLQGRTTTYAYDADGRVTATTIPGPRTFNYGYDDLGRLTSITDPKSQTRTLEWDALNQLSFSDALSNTTRFGYDLDGNRTSRTDANGALTEYVWDAANRLVEIDYPGGFYDQTATYDGAGRIARVTNTTFDLEIQRDAVGRVSSIIDLLSGRGLSYLHDAAGNRIRTTDSDGGRIDYDFDVLNRIRSIGSAGGATVQYSYDAAGRIARSEFDNRVVTFHGYDAAGFSTSLLTEELNSATVLRSLTYSYDAGGNRLTRDADGVVTRYSYDATDRLVSTVTGSDPATTYSYDAADNLLTRGDANGVTTFSYDAANRLTASAGADVATYSYDANGNRLTRSDLSGLTSYGYTPENQLERIDEPNGTTTLYRYDGFNRRSRRQRSGTSSLEWIRDALAHDNVVREVDGAGTTVARYAPSELADGYVHYESAAGRSRLHLDDTRSVCLATDDNAVVDASFSYDAFGRLIGSVGSVGDRGFGGADRGDDGLVHLRARDYDPRVGRFLQKDPMIGVLYDPGNLNPYVYVGNNPQNMRDPSGEGWFTAFVVVAALYKAAKFLTETAPKMIDNLVQQSDQRRKAEVEGDVEGAQDILDEQLDTLGDAMEEAANMPGTSFTGPVGDPRFRRFFKGDSALNPHPLSRLNAALPQNDERARKRKGATPKGQGVGGSRGANSYDGVEAATPFAAGGRTAANCGVELSAFETPGLSPSAIAVDPQSGHLILVDDGAGQFVEVLRDGGVVQASPIPTLAGGSGLSRTPAGGYVVTDADFAAGPAAVQLDATRTQVEGIWIFDGPNNPNAAGAIPQANDTLVLSGGAGPRVALVSSRTQASLHLVTLLDAPTAGISQDWSIVQLYPSPTGRPIEGLSLSGDGVVALSDGQNLLLDAQTLQAIGGCAAAVGAGDVAADPSGTVWNPAGVRTRERSGPDEPSSPPLGDADGDGIPDSCDTCPDDANAGDGDADDDGYADGCDCAPFNPAIHPGAAEQCNGLDDDCDGFSDEQPACSGFSGVRNLLLDRGTNAFRWSAVPDAPGYDLIRGQLDRLAIGSGVDLGPLSCLDLNTPLPQADADPLIPGSGEAFFYLVRVHAELAGYGSGSGGLPRQPGAGDCPVVH